MSELTLEKIQTIASQNSFSKPYFRKIDRVMSILTESELMVPFQEKEHIFFPRNLFNQDSEVEFYFISKHLITVFTYEYDENEQCSINVKSIPIKDDPVVELKHYSLYGSNVVCTITVQNGETLSFSSSDTNSHWVNTYKNQVIDIFKLFTTHN